jgi:GT2 family glycosyltransferase
MVAIVSYGRPTDVVACLAALARSSCAGFEVVVVENAGAAAFDALVAALAESWPQPGAPTPASALAQPARAGARAVRWHRMLLPGRQPVLVLAAADNLGYGGGVNLALRCFAEGREWRGVWILNPDTEPEPTALAAVIDHAERGGYGLVGCRLVLAGQECIQMRGGTWRRLIGRGKSIGYGEPADAPADVAAVEKRLEWISGAALYATRAFVTDVGPMNEQYFLYCEDVDWALRRGRFRLGYAHEAVVRHAHGTTIGSAGSIGARSGLSTYLTERNGLLLTRERFPRLFPLTALASLVLLPDYLVRGNRRAFRAAWRGWRAGMLGETGRPSGPL